MLFLLMKYIIATQLPGVVVVFLKKGMGPGAIEMGKCLHWVGGGWGWGVIVQFTSFQKFMEGEFSFKGANMAYFLRVNNPF